MKYSFNPKEFNHWKARVTESLVRHYIENVLIPKLSKEEWDKIIFTSIGFAPKNTPLRHPWARGWELEKKSRYSMERGFLIANGLYPTPKFLHRFEQLTNLLENAPDGYLIKLRRTGKFKYLKDALSELELDSMGGWSFGTCRFDRSEHDDKEKLPIVDGDVEAVEIKSDKSFIMPHQRRSYRKIIENGFTLRYFHVGIISFGKNDFEITEKLVKDVAGLNELTKAERRQNHLRRGISEFKK